jgi:hypothetical protein
MILLIGGSFYSAKVICTNLKKSDQNTSSIKLHNNIRLHCVVNQPNKSYQSAKCKSGMNPRHLCHPGLKEIDGLYLHWMRLGQRRVTGHYEGSNRSAECRAVGGPAACPSDCWLPSKVCRCGVDK